MHVSIEERRNTGGDILRRLFEPEKGNLSPEVARFLLSIDFSAADRARMELLAEKSQAGELLSDEREELNDYVRIGHLVALIQSKARKSLNQNGAAT
ncbi:MAG: hypothetical protein WD894_26105 [Pirellulales bacterium]